MSLKSVLQAFIVQICNAEVRTTATLENCGGKETRLYIEKNEVTSLEHILVASAFLEYGIQEFPFFEISFDPEATYNKLLFRKLRWL